MGKDSKRSLPFWAKLVVILVIAAAFMIFGMNGYDYGGYVLLAIAAAILLLKILGKALKIALVIIIAVACLSLAGVEIPITERAHTDSTVEAPYAVVLGAGVNGDKPSRCLTERLETAYDYAVTYPQSKLIVSGAQGEGENATEAQVMRDWLVKKGLDPDRIIMEDKATSTKENLQNAYDIIRKLGDDPNNGVALITSEFHLFRTALASKALGVPTLSKDDSGTAGAMAQTDAGQFVYGARLVAARTKYPVLRMCNYLREAIGVAYFKIAG